MRSVCVRVSPHYKCNCFDVFTDDEPWVSDPNQSAHLLYRAQHKLHDKNQTAYDEIPITNAKTLNRLRNQIKLS